jgi:HEAT repeat protein
MNARLLPVLLLGAACPLAPAARAGAAPDPADARTLRAAGLSDQAPALLAYFRGWTPAGVGPDTLPTLVAQLGSPNFQARERASAALVRIGPAAVPLLREAARGEEVEVARRAGRCLKVLGKGSDPAVSRAAARALARRNPPGAAKALLDFFPFAEDGAVAEEVVLALTELAYPGGRPDKGLAAALAGRWPAKRAAAAEALARAADAGQRRALAGLLGDADARVRLPVARALAAGGVREAIPVLIEVLPDVPADQVWQAEDVLQRLAGEASPPRPRAWTAALRKEYRDAWAAWWKAGARTADLAHLDPAKRFRGYCLVIEAGAPDRTRVLELDHAGKPRWQFEVPGPVGDAQVVGPGRVLLAEPGSGGGRVTERTVAGKVVWQKAVRLPVSCQRLPGGSTFIAGARGELLEVNRAGDVVSAITYHPQADLQLARRLPNGQTVVLAMGGRLARLNAAGKELNTARVYDRHPYRITCDLLPSGHLLMPQTQDDRVVEYDAGGRVVWSAPVRAGDLPSAALRLPGGGALVYCSGTLVELDRAGKEVARRPGRHFPLALR